MTHSVKKSWMNFCEEWSKASERRLNGASCENISSILFPRSEPFRLLQFCGNEKSCRCCYNSWFLLLRVEAAAEKFPNQTQMLSDLIKKKVCRFTQVNPLAGTWSIKVEKNFALTMQGRMANIPNHSKHVSADAWMCSLFSTPFRSLASWLISEAHTKPNRTTAGYWAQCNRGRRG